MRRPRQLVLVFLLVAAVLTITIWACRAPTQITVEVRTHGFRCAEIKRLRIAVAATPHVAEERMGSEFVAAEVIQDNAAPSKHCLSESVVGTLVVTPEEGTGAIVVAASYDTAERCVPPDYRGCIVARRAFSFVDRSSLLLPITLELQCRNVPCGVITSCRAGECVSSDALCEEGRTTCTSEAEPVFAADGGSIPPEASVQPDGAPLPQDDGGEGKDAGEDAGPLADASTDAPVDGPPHGNNFGNVCPRAFMPTDCRTIFPSDGICCYQTTIKCSTEMGAPQDKCGGVPLRCLGRNGCSGAMGTGYCCAAFLPPDAAAPTTTGCPPSVLPCAAQFVGGQTICTNHDDCPPNEWCTGIWWSSPNPQVVGGPIRKCTPTPP